MIDIKIDKSGKIKIGILSILLISFVFVLKTEEVTPKVFGIENFAKLVNS